MAGNTRATRNYARSIFDAASNANQLKDIHQRFVTINRLYKSIPEFRLLVQSRRIDIATKMAILTPVLKDIATSTEVDFFRILLENKEIRLFSQIMVQFFLLVEKESDTVKVLISTADKISDQSLSDIIAAVQSTSGKHVEHDTYIDPALLGGLTLRIGNTIVDGSVYKRLEKLKTSLMRA